VRLSENALKWVERGVKIGLKEYSSSDEEGGKDEWQKVINKKKKRK
jgi:hypothetical protein